MLGNREVYQVYGEFFGSPTQSWGPSGQPCLAIRLKCHANSVADGLLALYERSDERARIL